MTDPPAIAVILPALNEEEAIEAVLADLPSLVTSIIVVDNGSTDGTAERATNAGARVVFEPRRGYGRACQAGVNALDDADIIVFMDADYSNDPHELALLLDPILRNQRDFVLGVRYGSGHPWHARAGTWLCTWLINRIWGTDYHDLPPFKAIRRTSLARLQMTDHTWGWNIEMQVKAAEAGLRISEVPVRHRERIGQSKISGTVVGTLRAGTRMLAIIASLWTTRAKRRAQPTTPTKPT